MNEESAMAFSEMLQLAERWAREAGCETERTEGRRTDGSTIPSIAIQHGAVSLLCNERDGVLRVIVVMDIAEGTRAQLRRLDANQNAQFLSTLRSTLTQNPRGGFSCYPGGFRHASEIRQITLEQRLRIAANELSSFNRFLDAMQEVSIGALRVAQIFEPFHSGG